MKHFIIVKFKDEVNVKEILDPIKKLFEKALSIEGIEKVEVHVSNMNLQNRHDLMIEMELSLMALDEFDNSKIHKQWKEEYKTYIADKTIFDCD